MLFVTCVRLQGGGGTLCEDVSATRLGMRQTVSEASPHVTILEAFYTSLVAVSSRRSSESYSIVVQLIAFAPRLGFVLAGNASIDETSA